jgi:F420-dependent oxidoreductase-like protein
MCFGLQHPIFDFDYKDDDTSKLFHTLKNLITKAESMGFDSFWVMDHFHQIPMIGNPDKPMLEGWTTISVLAGITTKIKLGTLVTGILYRYPSVLAKLAATLDVLSNGRLFLGIGASYFEGETSAYGITSSGSFPSNQERLLRLEETIQIIRKMWTEEPFASFNGKYYQIHNAYCNPKPIQKPSPPILVGGGGEKKTLKIVAKYADACNLYGSVESTTRKLGILKEHCKSVGRDYDSILKTKLSPVIIADDMETAKKRVLQSSKGMDEVEALAGAVYGTPEDVSEQIEILEEAGIEYLIVSLDPSRELETLEIFADNIIKKDK